MNFPMYAGDAIAPPKFRAVDQYTGEVAPVPASLASALVICEEMTKQRDKAIEEKTTARAEVDDLMCDLVALGRSVEALTKSAGVWQSERDEMREDRDEWRDKCEAAQGRIDELEAENRELQTELDAARAERDTAKAVGS